MKHGRRHNKLKEQAYKARKDAEGYGSPYRAIDVAEPTARTSDLDAPPPADGTTLAARLNTRAKKALAWKGVRADEAQDDESDDA